MMGRHDFRNLCKMNCEQVYNFERVLVRGKLVSPQKVYVVSMQKDERGEDAGVGDENGQEQCKRSILIQESNCTTPPSPRDICHVEIVGQAFLWHQIRCIMSVLFYIGRGLESPTLVQQLLDVQTNPAKPSYEMASETALVLHECTFGQLQLGRTVRNLWEVTKVLEQRWEVHAVAAERARDAVTSLEEGMEVRWDDVVAFVEQIFRERRRKEQKRNSSKGGGGGTETRADNDIKRALEDRAPKSSMISWRNALNVVKDVLGVYPYLPNGNSDGGKGQTESSVHQPLMERSKGTTYEEKVQSILGGGDGNGKDGHAQVDAVSGNCNRKSSKRRERYEENIIKKRKTADEDKAFYDHMLSQGGSSK